ncbi:hypothetical protein AB6A23_14110 [Paenibacillus tarimensis]
MPVVCRHRSSGVIAAASLRNQYDLMYYGAVWWENIEEAEAAAAERLKELGFRYPEDWDLIETTEQRLKIMNVKLNNDSKRMLVMENDGSIHIRNTSEWSDGR